MNEFILDLIDSGVGIFNELCEKAIYLASRYLGDLPGYDNVVRAVIGAFAGTAKGAAYSLIVLFFLIGILKSCTNLQELRRPEYLYGALLRLAIATWLVKHAYTIAMDIYRICQGLGDALLYAFGWDNQRINISGGYLNEDMEEAILDASWKEALPLFAIALIAAILSIVIGAVILFTVLGRSWRIAILLGLSPLCWAGLAGEPTQGFTRGHLKALIACGLEVVVFFMAFRLYQYVLTYELLGGDGWTIAGALLWRMTEAILCQLILCGIIKGADRITEKVIA
ncbi:MAG: hypothetical protein Q4C48_10830 [Lachnospiraceae bacterium]|nr:hypothetical protein [Lachnospiraceae bacterium]